MKTLEYNYGDWRDAMLNAYPLALDVGDIRPVFAAAYGANDQGDERPDWRSLERWHGDSAESRQSLFRNGVLFVRLLRPFGVFVMLRWGGKNASPAFLQAGIGWKLNGRFGLLLRLQSDASAAAGVTGPNLGQAVGFARGTH